MRYTWRRLASLALTTALLAGTVGASKAATQPSTRAQTTIAHDPDFNAAPAANWLSSGGSLSNARYSLLNQINTKNVKNLTGAWEAHLQSGIGVKYSQEATPLVENGIMYVPTG